MGIVKNLFSIFQDRRELLDLTSFGDELAFKTSWKPLVGGGTNFCTHRLQKSTSTFAGDLLSFKTTIAAMLFSAFVIVLGICFFASWAGDPWAILALLFSGFGIWQFWNMQREQSVFDRSSRRLTKRGKTYNLHQVSAIQLIREHCSGNDSSYYSYELNLICSDGERINIVDHGSLHAIRKDAEVLADYLSIPVWDAIDFRIPE